jgi:hypothetical protein
MQDVQVISGQIPSQWVPVHKWPFRWIPVIVKGNKSTTVIPPDMVANNRCSYSKRRYFSKDSKKKWREKIYAGMGGNKLGRRFRDLPQQDDND